MSRFYVKQEGAKGSQYIVMGFSWTTHDGVWLSEKCWFNPGSTVIITDKNGVSKSFTKEALSGIAGAMPGRS